MKIYIAASFDQRENVIKLYKILQNKGYEIACDWTKHKPIKPYDKNLSLAKKYSKEDIDGVANSDIFIMITNRESTGAHVELGAAILSFLKFDKPKIYLVGNHMNRSLFYFHPAINKIKNIYKLIESL